MRIALKKIQKMNPDVKIIRRPTTKMSKHTAHYNLSDMDNIQMVPKAGVEPARPFGHCPLKTARLPIPPLRQIFPEKLN